MHSGYGSHTDDFDVPLGVNQMNITPESLVIIATGILLCLTGWHLFRAATWFVGILLGASLGYIIAVFALETANLSLPPTWGPLAVISVTVIFALFGSTAVRSLTKVVLFLAGFLFGVVAVAMFNGSFTGSVGKYGVEFLIDNFSVWSMVGGLAAGALFVFFEKSFVILYTSGVGAYLIAVSFEGNPQVFYIMLAIGTCTQLLISRGKIVNNLTIKD
jgi:hypothetical protein